MGAKGPVQYSPLSQEKAVELGAEMLGEFFLYASAASYIFYEYWKGLQKDKERDNTQDEQGESLSALQSRIVAMEKEMKVLNVKLNELTKVQVSLNDKSISNTVSNKKIDKK